MAHDLPVHDGFKVVDRRSGRGTWESEQPTHLDRAGVALTIPGRTNPKLNRQVAGTAEHPELFALMGDPDAGEVAVLRKRTA